MSRRSNTARRSNDVALADRPSRRGSVKLLTQPGIDHPTAWTMTSVRNAIDEHELGQFQYSAKLAREFARDDRIEPCIQDRINALVGNDAAEHSLQPAEGKFASASTKAISRLTWWDDVVTSAWRRKSLRDIIVMGLSLTFIEWEISSSEWRPRKLHHWDLENVYWSEGDGAYYAVTNEMGSVRIDPNDPNWLLITPGDDHSWLCGAVRGLGVPYRLRQFNYVDWARYNERHGLPLIVIYEPRSNTKGKREFYNGFKTLGTKGIVRAPQGDTKEDSFDVDLKEAKSRSYDSFDKFKDTLNTAVAIYLKGQNLTTEVQQGAYASTGWHMRVRKDYAENDAVALGEGERELIKRWGRYNERAWDDAAAPYSMWDLSIPEDQEKTADTMLKGAEAIEIFLRAMQSGVPIDLSANMQRLGIAMLKGKQQPKIEDLNDEDQEEDGSETDGPGADEATERADQDPAPSGASTRAVRNSAGEGQEEQETLTGSVASEAMRSAFSMLLGNYDRVAIVGGPRVGKSTLLGFVDDREAIGAEEFESVEFDDVPTAMIQRTAGLDRFAIESVMTARALRKGMQVDAVVYLTKPVVDRNKGQVAMGKSVRKWFSDWREMDGHQTPVFNL